MHVWNWNIFYHIEQGKSFPKIYLHVFIDKSKHVQILKNYAHTKTLLAAQKVTLERALVRFFQKITVPSIYISKSWDFNWITMKGWILSWYNPNLNIIIISVFILSLNVSDKWNFVIRSNKTSCTVVMNACMELKYFLSYRARKELSKDIFTCVYR